jgi:two-component system LytT family response regulator
MPKLVGFDVLELIGGVEVIFVTAYDQYAIRAFEKNSVDYLLKPFGAERLAEALDRARGRLRSRAPAPARELVSAARSQRRPLGRILIRDKADVHVVPVEKIDYIETQDDYVSIRAGGRSYLKEQTLSQLEGLLDPGRFVRIHRRYLLNVARLSRIEQSTGETRSAVLSDGTVLPVSRTGYGRLRTLL